MQILTTKQISALTYAYDDLKNLKSEIPIEGADEIEETLLELEDAFPTVDFRKKFQ